MKTTFLSFLLVILMTSTILAQSGKWEQIKISDGGYDYSSISCYNGNNCIILGNQLDGGYVDMFLRTTDGGTTWAKQNTSFPKRTFFAKMPFLRKVKMMDSLHAVAVGDSGRIVATSDGGTTWIESDSKTKFKLNDVAFYDKMNGMAVGYSGINRTTSDGGFTWQDKPNLTLEAVFVDIEAPAPHTYYIFDGLYSKMLRTYDDGSTWDTLAVFKDNLLNSQNHIKIINAASFSDSMNGWIAGSEHLDLQTNTVTPYIARTQTGGITWKIVYYKDTSLTNDTTTKIPIAVINDIFSSSPKACITTGIISTVLQTEDGGETWIREQFADTSQADYPISISVSNNSTAFVVTKNKKILRREFPSTGITEELNGGKNNQYFWITTIPIPATSYMEVSLYGLFSVKDEFVSVKVFNMLGVEVGDFSREANAGNNGSFSTFNADVSKLGGGVYVLQYSARGYTKSGLFVVAR